MTGAPAWLDELPVRVGPPWLSMGVHPLDLDDWLVLDGHTDDELALKRRPVRGACRALRRAARRRRRGRPPGALPAVVA